MKLLGGLLLSLMLTGLPFMVVILGSLLIYAHFAMPHLSGDVLVQQVLTGITPPSLICVPLFILGANLITAGDAAPRLVNMMRVSSRGISPVDCPLPPMPVAPSLAQYPAPPRRRSLRWGKPCVRCSWTPATKARFPLG